MCVYIHANANECMLTYEVYQTDTHLLVRVKCVIYTHILVCLYDIYAHSSALV